MYFINWGEPSLYQTTSVTWAEEEAKQKIANVLI